VVRRTVTMRRGALAARTLTQLRPAPTAPLPRALGRASSRAWSRPLVLAHRLPRGRRHLACRPAVRGRHRWRDSGRTRIPPPPPVSPASDRTGEGLLEISTGTSVRRRDPPLHDRAISRSHRRQQIAGAGRQPRRSRSARARSRALEDVIGDALLVEPPRRKSGCGLDVVARHLEGPGEPRLLALPHEGRKVQLVELPAPPDAEPPQARLRCGADLRTEHAGVHRFVR